MNTNPITSSDPLAAVAAYPLLEALLQRRSRRFCRGMEMPSGPLAYRSRHPPCPLSEEEEALLAFAACGITGPALADLCFAPEGGGNIMAGLAGRTVASGDGIQTVPLVVSNDQSTWLLRRPEDFPRTALPDLVRQARTGQFLELYRRSRIKIKNGRCAPPKEPLYNISANRWSIYAPGTTWFLPVNDVTLMYINGLLEILNPQTGVYVLDERAGFQPAGLGRFARSRGGHLEDDPAKGRVVTIRHVETMVTEFVTVEQGMVLQNLGLMAQALGLGGFPNFANHEFSWFQALGFRMGEMPASRYLGAGPVVSLGMRLLGRDPRIPYPLGLDAEGAPVLQPFCPPSYPTMTAAVHAVVERKFGAGGTLRSQQGSSAWKEEQRVTQAIPELSQAAVDATVAYCEYLWKRYGRFPAYLAPYRTVLGFQAGHLDLDFYDRFYHPDAVAESQRRDFQRQQAGS